MNKKLTFPGLLLAAAVLLKKKLATAFKQGSKPTQNQTRKQHSHGAGTTFSSIPAPDKWQV